MLSTEQSAANFSTNLRALCQSRNSISDVCRGLGISRQQFNKYLSGQHLPSRHNLNLIATFFLIEPEELTVKPAAFASKLRKKPARTLRFLGDSVRFAELAHVCEAEQTNTAAFCGVYERYQFSSIYNGRILRSLVSIRDCDGFICHGYVERFQNLDQPNQAETIFKFRGMTSMIAGRLFMIDFESTRKNEMTATFLIPRARGTSPVLFGLTMGVAASLAREPFATRVALRRVSAGRMKTTLIRGAAALAPDDPSIPTDIRRFLGASRTILRATDEIFGNGVEENR